MHVFKEVFKCENLSSDKVLLELSEEEVDVVDGVELCDEGLYVLQENLHKENIFIVLNALYLLQDAQYVFIYLEISAFLLMNMWTFYYLFVVN